MWVIENGQLTNTEFVESPSSPMVKPYPAALWRIDSMVNGGVPYHELLSGISALHLFAQPHRPMLQLYDSRCTSFNKNGYAVIEPLSGEIRHEKNALYSVSATFDADPERLEYIKQAAILKVPMYYHGELKHQLFRINSVNRKMDAYGAMQADIEAPHIFYDLNDKLVLNANVVASTAKTAMQSLFKNVLDGWTVNDNSFDFASDISASHSTKFSNQSLTSALIGDSDSVISLWGGNLYRDNFYFSINHIMENSRNTGAIVYRSNMVDIDFSVDYSECITMLYAVDNFGNTKKITGKNVPSELFPHHRAKFVSMSYDVEDKSRFERDAQIYFDNYSQPSVNIKVSFDDIAGREEYAEFMNLSDYEVGDNVIVYHEDLGINYANVEVIATATDICTLRKTSIELGTFKNAITRDKFMGSTASTSVSAVDKQIASMQAEARKTSLRLLNSWRGAKSFTWEEISKYKWKEVSKNGSNA